MENCVTTTEFINRKLTEPSTASKWGHSFIEAFNRNKRSFYLSYVLGLESTKPRSKALRGTALHAAIESMYTARSADLAPDEQMHFVIRSLLNEWLSSIEPEDRDNLISGAETMALDWLSTVWLPDQESYDLIGTEVLIEAPLPNGFPFTLRLDRLLRSKSTGKRLIRDTKTTGWRLDESLRRVCDGDQMTAYLWGHNAVNPNDTVDSAVAEVCYVYGKQHQCKLSEPITRSLFELNDYADKLVGLYADLAGRLRLWPRVDPVHLSLVWPAMYDETSVFEDEFVSLRRLHPRDLDNPAVTSLYGFRVNEARRNAIQDFLQEWSRYEDGIIGYAAEPILLPTG